MKPRYLAVALAIAFGATTAAIAQTAPAGGANPIGRGGPGADPFNSNSLYGAPRDLKGMPGNTIGRPQPRNQATQVTPVPEPSQWAMMIAGLALVGFIVKRGASKRS